MTKTTQAERLLSALRCRWHTWAELQALRVSTCPHVRLAESGQRYLRDGEQIARRTRADGLVEMRVVKA